MFVFVFKERKRVAVFVVYTCTSFHVAAFGATHCNVLS